jgi:hypothetical protein
MTVSLRVLPALLMCHFDAIIVCCDKSHAETRLMTLVLGNLMQIG